VDRFPPYRILLTLLILIALVSTFKQFAPDPIKIIRKEAPDSVSLSPGKSIPLPVVSTVNQSLALAEDRSPKGPEYPAGDSLALSGFFSRLLRGSDTVTIFHFGDSQLESDRITRHLRQCFVNDGFTRVRVLNFSKRGAQSPQFGDSDTVLQWAARNRIHPDLAILQYGLNLVRSGNSSFVSYQTLLVSQISLLQKTYPGVSVLIIGVSDMSLRKADEIIPYASVPRIRDAQRRAAALTGSAFWDLLDFMGGPGSGRVWFSYDEPLIRPDLCHFSEAGGQKVGKGIYQAIKTELIRYGKSGAVVQSNR
jgi:lysophospholipase L1-like esterase